MDEPVEAIQEAKPQKETPTLAVVISLVSAAISMCGLLGTLYYNFFWHPQDLKVSVRYSAFGNVVTSTSTGTATLIFTNTSTQGAAVDEIWLLQLAGEKIDLNACENPHHMSLFEFNRHSEPRGTDWDGTVQNFYRATRVSINNVKTSGSAMLVDAKSVKLMITEFDLESIGTPDNGGVAHCLIVSYFDRQSQPQKKVITATASAKKGEITSYSYSHGQPTQLLP